MAQITPDCCEFLETVAKCISPDFGWSRSEREQQLGTGVTTRVVFMPDEGRDVQLPFDVTKEAYMPTMPGSSLCLSFRFFGLRF